GGTATVKPRVFFGAGTSANPEQVGWIPVGRGGAPDIFTSDAKPALSSELFAAEDDFGLPGTIKEVDRIEFSDIANADRDNYLVASVSADGGTTHTALVNETSGSVLDGRVVATGFQQVFAPAEEGIEARR